MPKPLPYRPTTTEECNAFEAMHCHQCQKHRECGLLNLAYAATHTDDIKDCPKELIVNKTGDPICAVQVAI